MKSPGFIALEIYGDIDFHTREATVHIVKKYLTAQREDLINSVISLIQHATLTGDMDGLIEKIRKMKV